MFALIEVLAQSSQTDTPSNGIGALTIIITLLIAAIVIGAVWTFVAKRGSRVPERDPHKQDHVGRN